MNLADTIDRSAAQRPFHPAIEDGVRVVTYQALAALAGQAAAGLHTLGVRRGDLVALALPDSAEHVAVLFALARLGAASLSIDLTLPASELQRSIAGHALALAVVSEGKPALAGLPAVALAALFARPATLDISGRQPADGRDAELPIMVVQSSGTTGAPKRLLLTHRQLAARNARLVAAMRLGPEDRYFQAVPLAFLSGRRRCLSMLAVGGTVVFGHASSLDVMLACLRDRQITYTAITPAHLRPMLDMLTGAAPFCPGLRATVSTAPVTQEERLRARRVLTPRLFESYGTNELGDLALASPADQDARPAATGRIVAGVAAEVVDEAGRALAPGTPGLIRFKAPDSPSAYLDNPDATSRHFVDGWFYPGDRAALDADGFMQFLGRADEAINNSGVKFYPPEIEAVLAAHPRVVEAAVVAGPHPVFGEVAIGFAVVAGPPPYPDLSAYCAGRLAPYKVPWPVFVVERMPRIRTGKPDKTQLKALLPQLLARHAGRGPR